MAAAFTIRVKGRIAGMEAFTEFCSACEADLAVPSGWVAARVREALENGDASVVLKCDDAPHGKLDRVRMAAVGHGIDAIMTAGLSVGFSGSSAWIYTVRNSEVSPSLPYDTQAGEIMITQTMLKHFADRGVDSVHEVVEALQEYDFEVFEPFSVSYDIATNLGVSVSCGQPSLRERPAP